MAIIIPSANIFGSPNLYKIKDNYIDKIEVNANSVAPNNEYDVSVYNYRDNNIEFTKGNRIVDSTFTKADSGGAGGGIGPHSCAYIELVPYYSNISISFPNSYNNTYIKNVLYGKDKNDNNNIEYTITATKYIGTITGQAVVANGVGRATITNKIETNHETVQEIDNPLLEYSYNTYKVTEAEIKFTDITNIGTAVVNKTPTDYSISLIVLTGYFNSYMGGASNPTPSPNADFSLQGQYVEYLPQKIEITFYGETLSIDLTETTISLGESNGENPYSIDNNELLQTENYYGSEEQNAIESGYNKTLEIYKNGLESAEITCSISKYYDQNGEIKIRDDITSQDVDVSIYARYRDTLGLRYFTLYINSPLDYDLYIFYNVHTGTLSVPGSCVIQKGDTAVSAGTGSSVLSSTIGISRKYKKYSMTFNIGDLVIPMIYSNNKDVPISINGNGNAKVFRVIGKKIKYDGAVWQVLSLQEYKEVI